MIEYNQIVKYITYNDTEKLAKRISDLLIEGWRLVGEIKVQFYYNEIVYTQAMCNPEIHPQQINSISRKAFEGDNV